jgi:hypothetical protein
VVSILSQVRSGVNILLYVNSGFILKAGQQRGNTNKYNKKIVSVEDEGSWSSP